MTDNARRTRALLACTAALAGAVVAVALAGVVVAVLLARAAPDLAVLDAVVLPLVPAVFAVVGGAVVAGALRVRRAVGDDAVDPVVARRVDRGLGVVVTGVAAVAAAVLAALVVVAVARLGEPRFGLLAAALTACAALLLVVGRLLVRAVAQAPAAAAPRPRWPASS
jgi:hypothetical protein